MDARQPHASTGGAKWLAGLDQRAVLTIAAIVLLGIFGFAATQSHDPAAAQTAADSLAAAPTATLAPPTSTPLPTVIPKSSKTTTHSTTANKTATNTTKTATTTTPVPPTAVPNEAQTPLTLSDPTAADPVVTTPWWQSALDVTWKLGLVVGLIYLAMRGLAALKKHGFTTANGLKGKGDRNTRFFEQIEEIQLAPQHSLHAIRAGDRILLLARTNGGLRPLGEVDSGESADADAAFNHQLMRAWAGILPAASQNTQDSADTEEEDSVETAPAPGESVIEAQWVTVTPDVTPVANPEPAADDAALMPVRKGTARPSDKPAPPEHLDPSTIREILFCAEEQGVSAAAEKYGLTRQRVTAMRAKHERERAARNLARHRQAQDRAANVRQDDDAPITPTPRSPAPKLNLKEHIPAAVATKPDHPKAEAAEPFVPLTARASLARSAYQGATATAAPVTKPADAQAATVGQVLAARFGIKMPAGQ